MQFSTRLAIATHILLCIIEYSTTTRVTSKFLASSLQVHPVIIRQVNAKLSDAGLIRVQPGLGGATLARPAEDITLLDIFRAVEDTSEPLFRFHDNPNPDCPVGHVVHDVVDTHLRDAEDAMLQALQSVRLSTMAEDMRVHIEKSEAQSCGKVGGAGSSTDNFYL